jgi:carboxymethylenebutenolidase
MTEELVTITTQDGQADAYLYRPAGQGPWPGVMFFTDAAGVRQANRGMGARLAENGYAVLLPNPYYRDGQVREMHPDNDRDRFMPYVMNAMKDGGVIRDFAAYTSYLAAHPDVRQAKLGCTGYCMGGNMSLTIAGQFPERIGAAACFHGAALATDAPESPHRRAYVMRAQLYVGVAEIDPYLFPNETERLRGALEGAAVSHRMELYDGAAHGFTTPGEHYREVSAERHWAALLDLLKTAL